MIDLEGDAFADPQADHIELQYEYVEVCDTDRETPTCTVIGFEGFGLVGFPPGRMLRVAGRWED